GLIEELAAYNAAAGLHDKDYSLTRADLGAQIELLGAVARDVRDAAWRAEIEVTELRAKLAAAEAARDEADNDHATTKACLGARMAKIEELEADEVSMQATLDKLEELRGKIKELKGEIAENEVAEQRKKQGRLAQAFRAVAAAEAARDDHGRFLSEEAAARVDAEEDTRRAEALLAEAVAARDAAAATLRAERAETELVEGKVKELEGQIEELEAYKASKQATEADLAAAHVVARLAEIAENKLDEETLDSDDDCSSSSETDDSDDDYTFPPAEEMEEGDEPEEESEEGKVRWGWIWGELPQYSM
ncbi:hypothetical protein T484DRAFT_1857421, partial [Baffinella frigidus]